MEELSGRAVPGRGADLDGLAPAQALAEVAPIARAAHAAMLYWVEEPDDVPRCGVTLP